MKKIIIYYNFLIVSTMTFIGLFSAKTTAQFISALFFVPLAIYFGMLILPQKKRAFVMPVVKPSKPKKSPEIGKLTKLESGPKIDPDRRQFVKLIGSAGVTLFLFSIFTKKAHGAFFGSVPGPGVVSLKDASGTKIDPAEKHPTDGYKISRLDDSTPAYYGFSNKDGAWFIMKEDSSGNYTYTVGSSDFSTNWTGRAGLSYGEYFDKF